MFRKFQRHSFDIISEGRALEFDTILAQRVRPSWGMEFYYEMWDCVNIVCDVDAIMHRNTDEYVSENISVAILERATNTNTFNTRDN